MGHSSYCFLPVFMVHGSYLVHSLYFPIRRVCWYEIGWNTTQLLAEVRVQIACVQATMHPTFSPLRRKGTSLPTLHPLSQPLVHIKLWNSFTDLFIQNTFETLALVDRGQEFRGNTKCDRYLNLYWGITPVTGHLLQQEPQQWVQGASMTLIKVLL